MADYAHSETDKRIAELEKRLAKEYKQAYKETKDKLEKYLSDFKRKDDEKRQEVEDGTLSEKEYKIWRRNQMLTGQRWADMVDTLARDMNNVNVIAAQIVSGEMSETFSLNANYSSYEIENGYRQNYGFTLYDKDTVNRLVSENPDLLPEPSVDIPADLRWNKQKIVSNITQAVLQGKSIPEIAKAMETVVGMNKASAVRNARTAMTGAQNAGRQQAYERAEAMGIKLQKEWIATLDGRTRHSHGMADGQKVDINGMFKVGGCKMRYPGDVANGTAEEIYNCRCTMATVEPPEIMQGEDERMTYSEWLQEKGNVQNRFKSDLDNDIIDIAHIKTNDNFYNSQIENLLSKKIDYVPVAKCTKPLQFDEIISTIAGGDKTKGSCASVAMAYIGQMQGLNVLDFRDGESREWFSSKFNKLGMWQAVGANVITEDKFKSSLANAKLILNQMEPGKEYYLSAGQHAAIVRVKTDSLTGEISGTKREYQYLELQSARDNGWQDFGSNLNYTLGVRFGCSSSSKEYSKAHLTEIGQLNGSKEFRTFLGFVNTAESNQRRGSSGGIR